MTLHIEPRLDTAAINTAYQRLIADHTATPAAVREGAAPGRSAASEREHGTGRFQALAIGLGLSFLVEAAVVVGFIVASRGA